MKFSLRCLRIRHAAAIHRSFGKSPQAFVHSAHQKRVRLTCLMMTLSQEDINSLVIAIASLKNQTPIIHHVGAIEVSML